MLLPVTISTFSSKSIKPFNLPNSQTQLQQHVSRNNGSTQIYPFHVSSPDSSSFYTNERRLFLNVYYKFSNSTHTHSHKHHLHHLNLQKLVKMDHHQQQEYEKFIELIPTLPEELALECLTRLHYSTHPIASRVCVKWRNLIQSKDFYYQRKKTNLTQKSACLVQALATQSNSKPVSQPSYGISLFDPVHSTWTRVDPVPKYPQTLPMFCQVASTEGKLVVLGGWNPVRWEPVRDVFVYEFTTRTWTQCVDMPSTRSFFAVGAKNGKVFVAGGHDEGKNALSSSWVFNIGLNEWTELTRMSQERDECEGLVIGNEFWVVSGYGTEAQGEFKRSADVLNIESGFWYVVEDAWRTSKCPRSCVGYFKGKNGNTELVCWGESDTESEVRVASCGVDLGDRVFVTGSGYQGGPHGFYIVDKKKGQNGKLVKVNVDEEEFSGFVQSGCFVEI